VVGGPIWFRSIGGAISIWFQASHPHIFRTCVMNSSACDSDMNSPVTATQLRSDSLIPSQFHQPN